MKNRQILILLVIFIPLSGYCQSTLEHGMVPIVNVKINLPKSWGVNIKSEIFRSNSKNNTDLSLFLENRIRPNMKIGMGYLASFDDISTKNRTIQQVSFIESNPMKSFRYNHRIRADQTFANNQPVKLRFRYRYSAEIDLNFINVPAKSFYLKVGNEYLGSIQDDENDLEVRVQSLFGYKFARNKVEIGFDYRLDKFLNDDARHRLWTIAGIYASI